MKPTQEISARMRNGFLGCAAAGFFLSGCTLIPPAVADPTKYYVLTSPEVTLPPRSANAVRVGLRSVGLPGYLRTTKSMVVRAGFNEIRYEDYARWAEPLDSGLIRVLGDELLRSEAVSSVERWPYSSEAIPQYEISVRVGFYEGTLAAENHGEIRVVATYEISAVDGHRVLTEKTFTAPAKNWDGKDYGSLARLLSEGAVALADDVAAHLPK